MKPFIIIPVPWVTLRAGGCLWQKPAGGEMFYKLILLSRSLFSTHGFTWQKGEREAWQASPGPGAVLHPACSVYIYLLECPQRSSIFLISTGILLCLLKLLRRAWQSDSALEKKKKRQALIKQDVTFVHAGLQNGRQWVHLFIVFIIFLWYLSEHVLHDALSATICITNVS